MRAVAVAWGIGGVMLIQQPRPASVHAVVQQDAWRTAFEPSSASVSADGRYIAFTSYARLDASDVDERRDVYVLDRVTGRVSLETPEMEGGSEEPENRHPRLSADGGVMVYERAYASRSEIVRLDRSVRAATVITRGLHGRPDGFSGSPEISRDARLVVFSSSATNLVDGEDVNGAGEDIYLYDHRSGARSRISVRHGSQQAPGGSSVAPSLSSDGRYVVFASTVDFAGPALHSQRLPSYQIVLLDRTSNAIRLVSHGLKGEPANGASWSPSLSADGGSVAFVSNATNLVTEDRNNIPDVFVADLRTDRIELVSRTPDGAAANGRSAAPAISDDGLTVAFQSEASDMLCNKRCTSVSEDINLLWDVFIANRRDGSMRRVSRDASKEWMEPSIGPALDGSGTVVVFSSRHPIDASDTTNDFDLFICAPRLGRN